MPHLRVTVGFTSPLVSFLQVKQTWTTKVSTQGWGIDIRAKIALRKRLGRYPTVKELEDALNSEEKFRATPEEIHSAFDEGYAVSYFLPFSSCSTVMLMTDNSILVHAMYRLRRRFPA